MCFSALYLQHHYVVDILLGTAFAFIVLSIMTKLVFIPKEELAS
jgi:membrane-associated phospholipid phosphatase